MNFEQLAYMMTVRERSLLEPRQLDLLAEKVIQTQFTPGDMAEVGVYRGGSSYLIARTGSHKLLFACDSFEGLPEGNETHDRLDLMPKGAFQSSEQEVRNFLKPLNNAFIIPGWAPDCLPVEARYSFVHLDVDYYESTLKCLDYFYKRMSRGAVLVSDDYGRESCPGVEKAFTEFMADKPEKLVPIHLMCYFEKK